MVALELGEVWVRCMVAFCFVCFVLLWSYLVWSLEEIEGVGKGVCLESLRLNLAGGRRVHVTLVYASTTLCIFS